MNQTENILVTVSEECAEIAQAVSKALRFGLDGHHPDIPETTNADDIMTEFLQLQALILHLQTHGYLPTLSDEEAERIMNDKIKNVAKWQEVSFDRHTLQGRK